MAAMMGDELREYRYRDDSEANYSGESFEYWMAVVSYSGATVTSLTR